ncbi:MAG: hypothetical protein IPI59_10790 [Sphingobacteriales bacterium]|nr:hypothetical protein [Sphingobacteriales bacterium]
MQIILFDDVEWQQLLPLTHTRSAATLRVGILTLAEKWAAYSGLQLKFTPNLIYKHCIQMNIPKKNQLLKFG